MGTFRVPVDLYEDDRFNRAGMAATGLWLIAGCWSVRHKTLGRVPHSAVKSLGGTPIQVGKLISNGIWEKDGESGYKFVHWRKTQDGDYRPNIPMTIKNSVYERDGYRCVWCGSDERLSLDHIIPYRLDGPDTVANLRVLCMPCNQSRETQRRRGEASEGSSAVCEYHA